MRTIFFLLMRRQVVLLSFFLWSAGAQAQFLMDMVDTTKDLGKGVLSLYKRFDHVRMSGYIQPQYLFASAAGAEGYSGGSFPTFSNNRFMLRRGRIRFDYARFTEDQKPSLQFVFQFDGTERGVFIRDFWGRYWEDKWRLFYFTMGMFARPFGYEVNLSSSDREAPERGRMSQILMKTERDLGFMASFEPDKGGPFTKHVKIEAGIFNGQGLTGTLDFDGYKDFIGQLIIKPVKLAMNWQVGGGVSLLQGGMRQFESAAYRLTRTASGVVRFEADSITSKIGSKLPRKYYGINAQLKYVHGWGALECRAEYWKGVQTALQGSSETPGMQTAGNYLPNYIRPFDGAFFTVLQQLGSSRHQAGVKLDWYDPNKKVSGDEIGSIGSNLNGADVRYTTLGFGYIHSLNENLKVTLWYDWVRNEKTSLPELPGDLADNVFTTRVQFRF